VDESRPELNDWRRLHEAAIRVKEVAPWEWMAEADVFGVQDPDTGILGFVTVMGALGEHLALAVYLGAEGLYGFWNLQTVLSFILPGEEVTQLLFTIPHLQASFEDRNTLHTKDRNLIKKLGLKFRGRQAWPMFRSIRPGFLPWYLVAWEARFLTHALEQAVGVALRFKDDPILLDTPDDSSYLVRVPRREAETLFWEDRVMTVEPPEPVSVSIPMDDEVLNEVKRLPQKRFPLEVDFFMFPAPIRERGARPYFPYMLMMVDGDSGFIFGSELMSPEPDLLPHEVMTGVPLTLAYQLASIGAVPHQIKVEIPVLSQVIKPLADELGIKVRLVPQLEALNMAKEALLDRFA
jgi:hypothetical protein